MADNYMFDIELR